MLVHNLHEGEEHPAENAHQEDEDRVDGRLHTACIDVDVAARGHVEGIGEVEGAELGRRSISSIVESLQLDHEDAAKAVHDARKNGCVVEGVEARRVVRLVVHLDDQEEGQD